MLRRWPPCAHWRTSCGSSRNYSRWKSVKSISNTRGKNSRCSAHPEYPCRAHATATPSAWDDAEKQNPAAPAVRATLPYTPSLETRFLDRSADPCVDFYLFACGNWNRLNPIPADQARWDVYRKLQTGNMRHLWEIG